MNAIKPPVAPASTGNVYDCATPRQAAGGLKQWLDAFTAVLPARENTQRSSASGRRGRVSPTKPVNLAYPDLNTRAEVRANTMKDPAGRNSHQGSGLPGRDASTIMLPAPHRR